MEDDDPFAFITKLCHVSSSQEEYLRHCRFAHEPDDDSSPPSNDSSQIPVASTGIIMVSPPETPLENQTDDNTPRDNDNNNNDDELDVFQTPPEEASLASSQNQRQQQQQHQQQSVVGDHHDDNRTVEGVGKDEETMAVDDIDCTDRSRAVDLGRDTDLGFSSDVDSWINVNQAHDKEVIHCECMNSKRELPSNDSLGIWPSRRELASSNGSSSSKPCLRIEAEKSLGLVFKYMGKLNSSPKKSKNLMSESPRRNLGVGAEGLLKSMEKLGPFASERSKIFQKNLGLETSRGSLGVEMEERRGNLAKSVEKLNSDGICLYNHGLKSPKDLQVKEILVEMDDGGGREFHGESSGKRKLEFSTEVLELESEFEESDAVLGLNEGREEGTSNEKQGSEVSRLCNTSKGQSARRSIDDIDKFRYTGPRDSNSCEKERHVRGKRALPASFCGKENAGEKELGPDGILFKKIYKEVTLLDVLSALAKDCKHDPSLENLNILEVAKRSGMTFP